MAGLRSVKRIYDMMIRCME